MATVPDSGITLNDNITVFEQPSKTWNLDFDRGRITGEVDSLDAIKQASYLILRSQRFEHDVYSFDYGSQFDHVIGRDRVYVESEIRRVVRESLTQDDRINDVTDFRITFSEDTATVSFTVITTIGSFEGEVSLDV